MKQPMIVLTGPTAVGKTDISVQLAKAIGGEIISADSMQVYRHMNIGTAKIRPEQMNGIPHFLIDEKNPDEEFNVMIFKERVKECLREIYAKNKIPILVGGTGFYIQAVLYDIAFTKEQGDSSFRMEMQKIAQRKDGEKILYHKLKQIDPKTAKTIHPNNTIRIIRALEYYHFTGDKFSTHNTREKQRKSPYQFLYVVLNCNRDLLYQRINSRVEQMMEEGLVAEVSSLLAHGYGRNLVSMQGIGYKEIAAALDGECSLADAVYRIKRDTRHFAKRQLTWFRKERDVTLLDREKFENSDMIVREILRLAKEKGVIL